jgi:phosphoglycolate phosphatase-like HAD superfamily hydrolase
MRPTLILFDIDGTLVDTCGAGRLGLQESFRKVFGLDDIAGPVSRVRFDGKTDPTIIADIAREAGIPAGSVEARYVKLQEAYLHALRHELASPNPRRRVMPGVRALLDALMARPDVFLGLVTGNVEEGARAKLEAFGLNRYFIDGGFASDHPERNEITRIAHERLSRRAAFRFPADRVMVVGDTELDIQSARANAFRSIAVSSGWVPREQLMAAEPDMLLADLTDVTAVLAAMGLAE